MGTAVTQFLGFPKYGDDERRTDSPT